MPFASSLLPGPSRGADNLDERLLPSLMSFPDPLRWLLAATLVGLMVAPPPSHAGSSTAESVWDRRNARARALEQVPRGAVISRERCMVIGMRGNEERYRCTLWYTAPTPEMAPAPAKQP